MPAWVAGFVLGVFGHNVFRLCRANFEMIKELSMRELRLSESAIDLVLFVLNNDKPEHVIESQKVAKEISEQCQLAEKEGEN
jgi:hypothetical protein